MTDLKMFSKPVVFTDFDGVLNAFPDDKLLRRGGVNKVMTWLMAHPLVQRTVRRHVRVGS